MFIMVLFVIVLCVSIAFTFIVFVRNRITLQATEWRAMEIAEATGRFLVPALKTKNVQACEDRIMPAAEIALVDSIYVYDAHNELLCSYPIKSVVPIDVPKALQEAKDKYFFSYYVKETNTVHGKVVLVSSRKKWDPTSELTTIILFGILLGATAVSLFVAWRWQKTIAQPIVVLADAAKAIRETQDLQTRHMGKNEGEIEALSAGFDKMSHKVQRREKERDLAEAALRDSEERNRNLLEAIPDPIFVVQKSKVVYMNVNGQRLLGYDIKSEILEISPEVLFDSWEEIRQRNGSILTRMKRKDGSHIDIELKLIDTIFEGAPAIQGIAFDVTEEKMLREAADRMKRLAAIGELSAQIAHEIRNALGSIQLNLRYLSDNLQPTFASENGIANIQTGVDRIQDTITGVLNFARPNPPVLETVNLYPLLDDILDSVELELESAGIEVLREYNGQLPDLKVDVNQLRQVFLNLCLNSRQAMPSGGIIRIQTMKQDNSVVIELEDSGKGMPEEIAGQIFEPFFTTRPDGTGLGLAIVSRILQQHHAEISIESSVGRGTKVAMRFPLEEQS
jgi:PAS domain S-box-containing protein